MPEQQICSIERLRNVLQDDITPWLSRAGLLVEPLIEEQLVAPIHAQPTDGALVNGVAFEAVRWRIRRDQEGPIPKRQCVLSGSVYPGHGLRQEVLQ